MGLESAAFGLMFSLLGLASAAGDEPARCQQVDAATFILQGPVDEAMADCVRATLAPTTTVLVVDSGGGDLRQALDIAELLEPLSLTVRVRERCYSSCANYFLPLAERLVVAPGAAIVVHGGADPKFLHEEMTERREPRIREIMRDTSVDRVEAEARFEASVEGIRALIRRQAAFAGRHNVGQGWFLYREFGDRDVGRWLTGERGPQPHPFGWRLMLVEEPMLRSCLPEVAVEPFSSGSRPSSSTIASAGRASGVRRSCVR